MPLRCQLFNNSIGSVTLSETDPIDLDKVKLGLKRSKETDGIFYNFSVDLGFVKEAKEFIKTCYESLGIEAVIGVNLFQYNPNTYHWDNIYTGRIKLSNYSIDDIKLMTNIDQTGFEIKVTNLIDRDLDVETDRSQGNEPIPLTATFELVLHPKKILKKYDTTPIDNNEFAQPDVFRFVVDNDILGGDEWNAALVYSQVDNGNQKAKELEQTFNQPYGFARLTDIPIGLWVPLFGNYQVGDVVMSGDEIYISKQGGHNEPVTNPAYWDPGVAAVLAYYYGGRNEFYRATEAGQTDVSIQYNLKHQVFVRNDGGDVDICGEGALGRTRVIAVYEHRRQDNSLVDIQTFGEWDMSGCGGNSREGMFETKSISVPGVSIEVGDKLYAYYVWLVYGSYEKPTGTQNGHVWHEFRVTANAAESFVTVTNATEFPESTTKTVMIYEVLRKAAQYMTDQVDCFRSYVLGRPEIVEDGENPYTEDGEAALIGVSNGRAMRQLENQTIFVNWESIFKSISSAFNLSWGFERLDNGTQIIRVEKREHFYNADELIIDLGKVSGSKKIVDMSYYYQQVEIGYPKLENINQVNGVDEFNTLRRLGSPLTQAKSKLDLRSVVRSSGYEIESQRRLIAQTKESKLDDENFFLTLIREGLGFRTERGSDYEFVNNVFDGDSAYNLNISPMRNAGRWLNVLASNVIKGAAKIFRFTYGDYNYDAESKKASEPVPVSEKMDFDLTNVNPIYYPERYEINDWQLTRDQFRLCQQKPYGYIRFRDEKDVICEGFIIEILHTPEEEKADFNLLRVYRP